MPFPLPLPPSQNTWPQNIFFVKEKTLLSVVIGQWEGGSKGGIKLLLKEALHVINVLAAVEMQFWLSFLTLFCKTL